MGRRKLTWKYNGRRSQGCLLLLLTASTLAIMTRLWWFSQATKALLPPVVDHDLHHLRRERNLKRYLDNIQLLIEPSSSLCEGMEEIPLLVMASSAPSHLDSRMAIRHTWGSHLPTFFVLGLTEPDVHDELVDIYIEAKQYSDMVVYDLVDHYQNLTLKTALMLQWTRRRCPQAEFLLKTDDDVLVNPWTMRTVLKEHSDHQIFGYKINNSRVHREEHSKWYMPRWLHPQDTIAEYLSGTGYVINAEFIDKILTRAYQTPLINLEDVYFTQLVAKTKLGMTLTHDRRLSPYRPWIRSTCALWGLATAHSLDPEEILNVWPELATMGKSFENGKEVCGYFSFLYNDMFLF